MHREEDWFQLGFHMVRIWADQVLRFQIGHGYRYTTFVIPVHPLLILVQPLWLVVHHPMSITTRKLPIALPVREMCKLFLVGTGVGKWATHTPLGWPQMHHPLTKSSKEKRFDQRPANYYPAWGCNGIRTLQILTKTAPCQGSGLGSSKEKEAVPVDRVSSVRSVLRHSGSMSCIWWFSTTELWE